MGKDVEQTTSGEQTQSGTSSGSYSGSQNTSDWMNQLQQLLQQSYQTGGMTQDTTQQQQQQQTQTGGATQNTSQLQNQTATGGSTQSGTQVSGVDAASQAYIDQMRQQALGSLGGISASNFYASPDQINAITQQIQNPYTQQVLGGIGQEYDRLRQQAAVDTAQGATLAGAYGGSRHGVAEGERLGALDRAQTQQQGQVLSDSYNRALSMAAPIAQQQAGAPVSAMQAQQQILQGGLGPTGTSTTSSASQSDFQNLMNQLSGQMSSTDYQNLLGLLSGSSSTSGTNYLNSTGSSIGSTSGTSGGTSMQSGTQSGTQSSTGSSTNTQSQSNPWYQDVLGAGTLVAGLI